MPLSQPSIRFHVTQMKQYEDLCAQVEEQINLLCKEENVSLTKIAVLEALNNAVEHGEFPVTIEFSNTHDELVIKVKDNGNGFLVKEKNDLIREKGVDQLLFEKIFAERGRGICIMHKTVNKVIYNDKGNEVSLIVSNTN